jgi:hypothetical protein
MTYNNFIQHHNATINIFNTVTLHTNTDVDDCISSESTTLIINKPKKKKKESFTPVDNGNATLLLSRIAFHSNILQQEYIKESLQMKKAIQIEETAARDEDNDAGMNIILIISRNTESHKAMYYDSVVCCFYKEYGHVMLSWYKKQQESEHANTTPSDEYAYICITCTSTHRFPKKYEVTAPTP